MWTIVQTRFQGSLSQPWEQAGLSLIFQVAGELKKVAGGQKTSSAAAELAGGGWLGTVEVWDSKKLPLRVLA